MKYSNGDVIVSKSDCKAVRLIMGFNPDLRVKLSEKVVDGSYAQASIVVRVMADNHLCFSCDGETFTKIINDKIKMYCLAEKCLRGVYDYE